MHVCVACVSVVLVELLFDRVDVFLGLQKCTLTATCYVQSIFCNNMYCAYPVPGVASNSLMYYYNGKTVR